MDRTTITLRDVVTTITLRDVVIVIIALLVVYHVFWQ